MASHTIAEVQTALNKAGFGPVAVDGAAGPQTDAAVAKFQTDKGLTATGTLDPTTLNVLFPGPVTTPKTIQGTITDYILNLVKSKSAWAAAAGAAAIVAWINTRFGLNLGQDVQNLITGILAAVLAVVVGFFQTFMNSPHMTTKQPAVVQQPAETK